MHREAEILKQLLLYGTVYVHVPSGEIIDGSRITPVGETDGETVAETAS